MRYFKNKNIDFKLIQILLFGLPFLFGCFYEFASYFAQIAILIVLIIKLLKEKKLNIYLNYSSIALACISFGYLLSCIYAIDRGMAFLGFLKFSLPLTFSILIMQYQEENIKDMVKFVPISGIAMCIVSFAFKYIPFLPNEFYLPNGRMGGFFQYSNTFALFLLIGIICTSYSDKSTIKKVVYVAFLLIGIFLSGSRAVLVLTIFNIVFITIKFKDLRKYLLSLVGLGFLSTLAYVVITKNFNTIGRYLTISVNSSTLLGRLLYYKDAFFTILKHPFGLGYMGYYYIQPQIKTGVYQTLYVHNDFLQLALDIGILPLFIFIVAIFKNLLKKRKNNLFNQILLTIVLHILVDFDLQFIYIFILFILMLNNWTGKKIEYNLNKKILIGIVSAICVIYLYFGICTLFNYLNESEKATKMYPIYTEANLSNAYKYSQDDEDKANKLASKILETNSYCDLAYNIKAIYYMQRQNWKLMIINKQKALELAKYDMNNYEEYVLMLSVAIDFYTRNDDMDKATEYMKLVADVPSKIQNIKNNTSSIAYKLIDVPSFELSSDTQKYIDNMRQFLED